MERKSVENSNQFMPVKSSNIEAVGFCGKTNCIFVRFKNGSVYEYADCDQKLFDDLMGAESKGKFVSAHLKSRQYKRLS